VLLDRRFAVTAPFIDLGIHHQPKGISDRIALGFTKVLRWTADTFFAERYGHRAVVLETVAAVSVAFAACATIRAGSKPSWTKPKTSACT
jgi:ubiquinol oxidase